MNPETLRWVLAAHVFVTLFMTGLIWFVQVVHYPLFARVGKAEFAGYEQQHTRRTGWVVGGPMVLELGLAAALAWSPGGTLAWCGLGLIGIIWLSTALVHDPDRPAPTRVDPGPERPAVPAPDDAIVLFDGKNLDAWQPGERRIKDGEIVAGAGRLTSLAEFGNCQIHVEWLVPVRADLWGNTAQVDSRAQTPCQDRPLVLLGHNCPVRFRNIWVRRL